ncbi:hypothetical protein H4R24_005416 [Coemansia sp. RSA 988]|nr:hypothetical protein H4R24_005416 [Coemansia sp. RSA 988]
MQGPCKLPENLPKLTLGGDSYNFAMEMVQALQACRYNLDEWGTKAMLLSVDQHYADAMMHTLQRDLQPTWKEVVKMLLCYAPARLTSVEAGCHLGMICMDIFEPLLCYLQKFEKLHMLTRMCRDAREVHTHFLSGLDCKVRIMFTSHFPMWLEDGQLDEGYAYVSKLQETFNTITWNISYYTKFHQAIDDATLAKYGAATLLQLGSTSASTATPWTGGGDMHPCMGMNAATGAQTDSHHPLDGRRDQCRWPRNNKQWDHGLHRFRGNTPLVNVQHMEVDNGTMPEESGCADADIVTNLDWSGKASWPDEEPTVQQVNIFGEFREGEESDLEVHMSTVNPSPEAKPQVSTDFTQPRMTQGTIQGDLATEKQLLEPWCIPVCTSAGGLTVAMWAELNLGASHTLVSKCIVQQLRPTITPKGVTVCADVLPGECSSPILIGQDVLAWYQIDDLLSVLMDQDREQLAMSAEPDVTKLAPANDSSHRSDMLSVPMTKLQANTTLDKALAPVDCLVAVRCINDLSEAQKGVNGFGSSDNSGPCLNAIRIHAEVARNLLAYQAKMALAFSRVHKPAELAQGDQVVLPG